MKTIPNLLLLLLLLLTLLPAAQAQIGVNSPAGVTPALDLELYTRNSLVVSPKYRMAATPPVTATYLIGCGGGSNPPINAESGILLDPSGYTGYANNVTYNCIKTINIPTSATHTVVGIEFIFEQLDLGPDVPSGRDYMYITSDHFNPANSPGIVGTTNPGRIVVPDASADVEFTTRNDGIGGLGFRVRWRALYAEPTSEPFLSPVWTDTPQLRFDIRGGALFAGLPPVFRGSRFGVYSVSLGLQNMTRGDGSVGIGIGNLTDNSATAAVALGNSNSVGRAYGVALGNDNAASGDNALALGYHNFASGNFAVAIGANNSVGSLSGGAYSIGLGRNNSVVGNSGAAIGSDNSVAATNGMAIGLGNSVPVSSTGTMAIGTSLVVTGNYATAMGTRMNTNGQSGAFMIGDADPLNQGVTPVGAPNQFVARFLEGFYLMTCGNNNPGGSFGNFRTGVQIGRGQNSWAAISDSTKKEHFLAIDHTNLLQKIGAMRLTTWNYKGQHNIRHYGPMAQDFYAAFGHDGLGQIGCDTLIYSHDFAGVTFAGVQALIHENEKLKAELTQLKAENAQTKADFLGRLQLLERAMLPRRERVTARKTIR